MNQSFKEKFLAAKRNPRALPFSALDADAASFDATEYDYIVLGAGSAGSIIAANLARVFPNRSIALVEAGPVIAPTNTTVWDPTQWVLISQIAELEWGFQSTPQTGLDGRVIPMGRSKGLGGCAIHNAMVYVRGGSLGYDNWANNLGCTGWSYKDVVPYFNDVEAVVNITTAQQDAFMADLIVAAGNHGLVYNANYNQELNEACVSPFQFAISQTGERETTFSTYLATPPANIDVGTGWTVEKILIDDTLTARGVVLSQVGGPQIELSATNEIIVCAGAFGSPQILMLSGVGPATELSGLGIQIIKDLPGVGQNLQDDLYVTAAFTSKLAMPPQPYGLMGSVLFANTPNNNLGLGTDIECSLASGTMVGMGLPSSEQQSYFIYPNIQLLESRGTVTLASTDPFANPVIDPNYLASPGDITNCIDALKLAIAIGSDSAMASWMEAEFLPSDPSGDLEAYVRRTAGTCYHYAGTCKMGTDASAVVTPDLRVIGINALRVVDASVIPRTVSGNTAAATMMIAAKGSSIIAAS